MAKRPLTDEQALTICRTPKPTPAKMRKVVDWAATAPSGDKIQPLLILQTQNWASRKDLHNDFHASLGACAAVDAEPLWHSVQGDHDTYRVWHAIHCICALDEAEPVERLVQLGDTPLMGIHWKVIEQAAERHGIAIPERIRHARALLCARQNVIDFYAVYEAREPAWPAELDPDPRLQKHKRVVLKTTVDAAAKRRAEELRGALEALGTTLEKRDPDLLADWRRNAAASDEQLAELAAELFGGKTIPPELDVWFRWHLGAVHHQVTPEPEPLFYPLDVGGCITSWKQLVQGKQDGELLEPYRVSWLPLFADGAGDFLCIETAGAKRGRIVEFFHDDAARPWPYKRLADWALQIAAKLSGAVAASSAPLARTVPAAAALEVDPSWRFEVGALSSLQPSTTFRSRDEFDALPIGTAIAWDRQYLGNSNFLTVKLAPGLWCGALSTSIHAAHRAIVGLAVRYPPLVWLDGEDGLYGALRDRDVVRRMGSCAVRACASRVGSS